jgi:hypothetical protein
LRAKTSIDTDKEATTLDKTTQELQFCCTLLHFFICAKIDSFLCIHQIQIVSANYYKSRCMHLTSIRYEKITERCPITCYLCVQGRFYASLAENLGFAVFNLIKNAFDASFPKGLCIFLDFNRRLV